MRSVQSAAARVDAVNKNCVKFSLRHTHLRNVRHS